MRVALKLILLLFLALILQGCIVDKVVSLPFKATGAVLDGVGAETIGSGFEATGEVIETIIPF